MISRQEMNILRSIHLLETPTRAEISRFARVSGVSVTARLSGLQERGLVEQGGKVPAKGGRPSIVWRLAPNLGCSIGVFFEGNACHIVALDAAGGELAERATTLSLSAHSEQLAEEIVAQVATEVRGLLQDGALRGRRALAICVAPPGMVDPRRGVWLHGMRLSGIEHIELGPMLERALETAVLVEDPARCLAHLALTRIGREEAGDLLLLYLGSGVGAGFIVHGELYHGNGGLAGEIGHLVVEELGERCACGNAGCLETVASAPAILRRFKKRLDEGVISGLQRFSAQGGLTLEAISEAAAAGDRLALSLLADIGTSLGEACGKSIMLLNPRTLCIAGPVAVLGEYMRETLWARIRRQVIPEMLTDLQLKMIPSRPGDEARGAALLAARWFWDRVVGQNHPGVKRGTGAQPAGKAFD